jgi:hypothetical protein
MGKEWMAVGKEWDVQKTRIFMQSLTFAEVAETQ